MSIMVSVIVPFHRSARGQNALLACLDSCLQQSRQDFEVLVVSNLPDPALESELAPLRDRFPRLRAFCAGAAGVNRARNFGARHAQGQYLFFLDEDCVLPDRDFLARLCEAFAQDERLAGIGGGYLSLARARWKTRGYNAMATAWVKLHVEGARTRQLLGGNACYRRELFAPGPAFRDDILSGGDEAEFNLRLTGGGHRLGYCDRLSVVHLADDSWTGLALRALRQARAKRKHGLVVSGFFRRLHCLLKESAREPALLPFSACHFLIGRFAGRQ